MTYTRRGGQGPSRRWNAEFEATRHYRVVICHRKITKTTHPGRAQAGVSREDRAEAREALLTLADDYAADDDGPGGDDGEGAADSD